MWTHAHKWSALLYCWCLLIHRVQQDHSAWAQNIPAHAPSPSLPQMWWDRAPGRGLTKLSLSKYMIIFLVMWMTDQEKINVTTDSLRSTHLNTTSALQLMRTRPTKDKCPFWVTERGSDQAAQAGREGQGPTHHTCFYSVRQSFVQENWEQLLVI